MMNVLCDFVDNFLSSETTYLSSLVVISFLEKKYNFFSPDHGIKWSPEVVRGGSLP